MGQKDSVTKRAYRGETPFTVEQWVRKRKKDKAARKQKKEQRQASQHRQPSEIHTIIFL